MIKIIIHLELVTDIFIAFQGNYLTFGNYGKLCKLLDF